MYCEFLVIAVVIMAMSCTTSYTRTVHSAISELQRGNPQEALSTYREVYPDSTGKNRLLYLMETGNLLRLSGNYQMAETVLLAADRLSDTQRGIELGQEVESFLTSDRALEFRGADYEKILINYCLAACYASEGDMENALVECRHVNDKLKVLNSQYDTNPNRYNDDAFVRYMMGVLYEQAGDLNNALIAYRNSSAVYDSSYAQDYGIATPERLKADILRLSSELGMTSIFQNYSAMWTDIRWQDEGIDAEHGEIVVFLELGMIAEREEENFTFTVSDRVYRVALPIIPDFSSRISTAILTSGSYTSQGFLAEDLNSIARENLEDQAGRDIVRATARVIAKAGVAEAGEQIVEEFTGENSIESELTGLVLSIFGAATEAADLRAWLTLPAEIYVVRLTLPVGTHPVTLTADGNVVYQNRSFDIEANTIELLFLRESGI